MNWISTSTDNARHRRGSGPAARGSGTGAMAVPGGRGVIEADEVMAISLLGILDHMDFA